MSERARIKAKAPETKKNNLISNSLKNDFNKSKKSPGDKILFLQKTIGNQAVQRMIRSAIIQEKLGIGQPGDIYEQEADRVAEQVMRTPELQVQRQPEEEEEDEELIQTKPLSDQITPVVHRQVEEEEEEEIQTKPLSYEHPILQRQEEEEEELLMTKSISERSQQIRDDLHIQLNQSRSSGQPLPEMERSFMEKSFGIDLGSVRIHTDNNAEQMSRKLNAAAFTYGRDIYFGAGKYNPGTLSGKKLMAHELTHVVQQSSRQLRFKGSQENQNLRLRERLIKTKPISGTTGVVIQRRFINRGETAVGRVHWAGGTGGRGNQPVGSIQRLVIPVFLGRNPRGAGDVARAWIRPRTGLIRIVRSYTGVRAGNQGGGPGNRWYLTKRAARRSNRHERMHPRTTRNLYRRYISPLLRLVRRYKGRRRGALRYGSTQAEAIARLRTIVGWNPSINDFRNQDIAFNNPGGTVDAIDTASGTFPTDCGAGNVGGVHYNHRVRVPGEACPT